ncbi:hypothetical protein Tco_1569766 [Tanacetum coccineum]|uniref:Uncharacterized protein n=1 Tax=Tanacetum coccineum TaxID=301880 RepID=A0ABQ5J7P0_9ASTR
MTVHDNLPEPVRTAQVEACKKENIRAEIFLGEGKPFEVRSDVLDLILNLKRNIKSRQDIATTGKSLFDGSGENNDGFHSASKNLIGYD